MAARQRESKEEDDESKKASNLLIYSLYAAIILLIIAYILTDLALIGLLAFVLIIAAIVLELRASLRYEGGRKTLVDIAIAIVAAVLLFWVIPALVLQTGSPINVVESCSMLPTLHRGDLVLLHGISNMSLFLTSHKVPVVNVTEQQFSGMVSNMQNEFVEPFAYYPSNPNQISSIIAANASGYGVGFYNLECIAREGTTSSPKYSQCQLSSQASNLITYNYATAKLETKSGNESILYVPSIMVGSTSVVENYTNPIIVYRTTSRDYFSGDIIHRLVAAINVDGKYYLLTKGDNNPILDIESLNYPANQSDVLGYVVSDIPYLGFPSLIIKGQISPVAGCSQTIVRS